MVKAVIAEVDASVPVIAVRATRGKWLRAEPVATLYEQGRVRHAGSFPRWKMRCAISQRRPVVRPLARPARRAGVGGDRRWRSRHAPSRGCGSCERSQDWSVIAGHSRSKNGVASLAYDLHIQRLPRGLDPRVHLLQERWMAGLSPAMTRQHSIGRYLRKDRAIVDCRARSVRSSIRATSA